MLDFKEPTAVTVLGTKEFGSTDSGCQITIVVQIEDFFGRKGKIFLHNKRYQSLLEYGTRIVIQEKMNPENKMAREYDIGRYMPAHVLTGMLAQSYQTIL